MNPGKQQQKKKQSSSTSGVPEVRDPESWVRRYGDVLFRYSLARLRDTSQAEDLVQETFLAGLKSWDRFAGRSSEQGWLMGILKNKIADHFRKTSRESSFADLEFLKDEQEHLFKKKGLAENCWIHRLGPRSWRAPDEQLDREEFWVAFDECVSKLPDRVAEVFLMRELDEQPVEEICQRLDLLPNHLYVMLHRARMALRYCLERGWFGKQSNAPEESR